MNVLVVGMIPSPLTPILREHGCDVSERDCPIDVGYLCNLSVDFLISYGYRHIVQKPVINYLNGKAINLHISFLPWNRGADPNLWSFLEDTPKGVTIHYIDEGLDSGGIIYQKEIFFILESETLATTYKKLNEEIVTLFRQQWPFIMTGDVLRRKQPPGGSFHLKADKKKFEYLLLENGWYTPVKKLIGKALFNRNKGL